ncbi:MAG: hypothetical protein HXX12_08350 [Geothrix sp.]|uniref:hypothetical protein n=1 Tax=Geothrix sp. TaxID=1962974 RepID=UPI0017B52323|nr:hypothetical protein [Geothrix sp.]NWJ40969.1 hypothetical protein [Geothrix sp.]WIL21035.1 MAG: hypothetical protein QOZ81_000279 [Geothrix sp.]
MEFEEIELGVIQRIKKLPKCKSRFCFQSAVHHLEKAEKLLGVDNAMAAFRAITAEEEAATGLMCCLQELNYPNADKLQPRSHLHKNAVAALLAVLGHDFGLLIRDHGFEFTLVMKKDGLEPPTLHIRNKAFFGDHVMVPDMPFNFLASTGDKLRSFSTSLSVLATEAGAKNILDYIRREANIRNHILYASGMGVPMVLDPPAQLLNAKWKRVIACHYIYLSIKQYPSHQLFLQQAIDAFLAMLKVLPMGELHPES